jgi:hypothetical protein
MSNQIPGVPEGWELVGFRKPNQGDFVINWVGKIERWNNCESAYVFPIIRKIEKPARYRQFANAAEADQLWNVALRYRNSSPESKHSRFRINTIRYDGITIGLEYYSYKAAFDGFCIDDDGTPFGIKIEESKENE